ncbi:YeeE/YedE thiosulfate transporter family protein [Synechococcus sp. 1G10]|uniref:YeeE/YedE thiosulfate transporter family protein n=1 Tax=Synechococcus sp. 1G10 TaxID=2025605 RepID=UPI001E45A649|nr:YeeE/YedE thiosulfate transporter family protein [Synechococcus sp. 1G10]
MPGALLLAAAFALAAIDGRDCLIWLLGCALGLVLTLSRFGFSSGYRRLITERDPGGIQAQLLLAALLVVAMGLALAFGAAVGLEPKLLRTPLSLPFLGGAFLFGVGIALARGCACGTLAATSRGGWGVMVALAGLVVGAFLGSLQRPLLAAQPQVLSPVILDHLALPWTVLLQLAGLALLAWLLQRWRGRSIGSSPVPYGGAALLALAATGVLLVTGEPWKVLWGLAITGAKAATWLGWNPEASGFWSAPARMALLQGPRPWWLQEAVLLDLGLISGALAGGFSGGTLRWRGPGELNPSDLMRRGIGGLAMGFGGLLASGCNVNAFLGGVMSFSLHGWVWIIAALLGFATALKWSGPGTVFSWGAAESSRCQPGPSMESNGITKNRKGGW